MRERPIDTSTGRFHILDAGEPNAPLVLCLHGFPDHAPGMAPLLSRLAAVGYRAVAPWMRGYAPSTLRGPYHVRQLARDALALADALRPREPARLVGHDWGAVATYAACAGAPHRVAAAVTLAVPHPLAVFRSLLRDSSQRRRSAYMGLFQLRGLAHRLVSRNDFAYIDRLWRIWSPGYTLPDNHRAALHRCLAASLPAPLAYYRALLWPPHGVVALLRGPIARRIAVPTLHLHGAQDGCIGVQVGLHEERMFRGTFERRVLSDAGHFLTLEAPEAVAQASHRWFVDHAPAGLRNKKTL